MIADEDGDDEDDDNDEQLALAAIADPRADSLLPASL